MKDTNKKHSFMMNVMIILFSQVAVNFIFANLCFVNTLVYIRSATRKGSGSDCRTTKLGSL